MKVPFSQAQSAVLRGSKCRSCRLKVPLWFCLLIFVVFCSVESKAQVGDYRNVFTVGVNGGMTFSSVGFSPKVTQKSLPGYGGGLSFRYTSEKYFSTICSIYGELNYNQMGWREDVLDLTSQPVKNPTTGENEAYERRINYVQVPVFAHLAWGGEEKGVNFFVNLGPQFGYMLSESTTTNFTSASANLDDRANPTIAQCDMEVEKKFDYGIAVGMGVEFSHTKMGHFFVEGRYYLGLGNIYGASSRDYFAKSNHTGIYLKAGYMVDLNRNGKRKK